MTVNLIRPKTAKNTSDYYVLVTPLFVLEKISALAALVNLETRGLIIMRGAAGFGSLDGSGDMGTISRDCYWVAAGL